MSSDEDIDVVHNHVVDKWIGSNDIQGGKQNEEVGEDTNIGSVARLSEGSLQRGREQQYVHRNRRHRASPA